MQMQFDFSHSFSLFQVADHVPDFSLKYIHDALSPLPKLPFFFLQLAGASHYHAILNHQYDVYAPLPSVHVIFA